MQRKYKYLLKNMGIFTICNFASKILIFLLVPLYTSVLTTEEYGIYDLVVNTVAILLPVLTLNVLDGVVRFTLDNKYDKGEIAKIGLRYIFISGFIVLVVCFFIKNFSIFSKINGLEWLIFIYYISYVFHQFLLQLARGFEKIRQMGIAGIINTIVLVGCNLCFLIIFKMGIKGFFISTILASIIPTLYLAIKIEIWKIIKNPIIYDNNLKEEIVDYSFPLVFSTISWWINSASDKYIVSILLGVAENGVLSVAYKIPGIINIIFGMFGQAWQISAIKEYESDGNKVFYENIIKSMNTLTIVSCGFLIGFSECIGKILYSKDFYRAWTLAPFLIVSIVFNNASGLLGPILSAIKDTKTMAKSAIIGGTVNIILNVILIYIIGTQGATIATVISAAVIYIIRKKAVDKELSFGKDFTLWLSIVVLIVEALVVIYRKKLIVILFIIMLILLINKKNLMFMLEPVVKLIRRIN